MIQLNLLPDIKLAYIKAERTRRLVLSASFLVAGVAIVILLLLLSVDGLQKKHLSDLNKDINSESSKLQNEPQINKILTVQNQLNSLTNLHSQEPAASRLFDYLNEVTPTSVSISDFTIDFTQQTATITGTSDNLAHVNQYVDTLKSTTYTSDNNPSGQPAFSNIVLSSFSLSSGSGAGTSQSASYSITLSYDTTIFDITQNVKLTVPSITTTYLSANDPNDLFKAAPSPSPTSSTTNGGQQ
ncbi:MAG TPA: PilN domain-containing protein [Candidatus Saccharimonadales bacterium]|nr:PilN domain-containing protein [Candidatus Saccharimonadales bacterium]